jgi:broad specificity phosphatase PhoE
MPPDETVPSSVPSSSSSSFVGDDETETTTPTNDGDDKQYLFIIRHGDRWDYRDPSWKELPSSRLGDSPLSTLGHQQGRQVGQFMDKFLKTNAITEDVTWLSSPFLRCIQTSNEAIQELTTTTTTTTTTTHGDRLQNIRILPEYSIFEWDGHDGEWHKDLPTLEERKHYFPRLDITYESFFTPRLPGTVFVLSCTL